MDWIHLAQVSDQRHVVVNTKKIFGFHKMLGNSRIDMRLASSQEGLSSMELGIVYCAAVVVMFISRGNLTNGRKPVTMKHRQPPYDLTWDRASASTLGSQPELWHSLSVTSAH
jgi:hypothetical protein